MRVMNSCRTLASLIALVMSVSPVIADTLSEAIQQGLIAHPDMLLSANNTLPLAKSAERWHAHSGLGLDNHARQQHFTPAAALALGNQSLPSKDLTRQDVNDDFVLGIINRYLYVLRSDKLLENAQLNFRLHRSVYMALSQEKDNSSAHQAELRQVRARLAAAELAQMHAESVRHKAKTAYARVVGRWPTRLEWPEKPDSHDLPASVGQAIEQGLDNYSVSASAEGRQALKRRSMIALSDAIRQSWEDWTAIGLQINPLQKRLVATEELRDALKESFMQDKNNAIALLDAQTAFYEAQNKYVIISARDLSARYRILNSVGKLMPFVTRLNEDEVNMEGATDVASSAQSALLQMADSDKTSLPYPSYKPEFQAQLEKTMQVTALSMPGVAAKPDELASKRSSAWYVSAGHFRNKANAIALAEKLKALGFMVDVKTRDQDSSVLIGPYEFRRHAVKGMSRLKETAHVRGVLVAAKPKNTLGYGP